MADYQDYYNQYSTATSKNDESGGDGSGGTTGGATDATLAQVRDRLPDTKWFKLQQAADLAQAFVYLSPGTIDERVSTITYTSASLSLTATETFTYDGAPGSYRISAIART